jgi:hypothetical protein
MTVGMKLSPVIRTGGHFDVEPSDGRSFDPEHCIDRATDGFRRGRAVTGGCHVSSPACHLARKMRTRFTECRSPRARRNSGNGGSGLGTVSLSQVVTAQSSPEQRPNVSPIATVKQNSSFGSRLLHMEKAAEHFETWSEKRSPGQIAAMREFMNQMRKPFWSAGE